MRAVDSNPFINFVMGVGLLNSGTLQVEAI